MCKRWKVESIPYRRDDAIKMIEGGSCTVGPLCKKNGDCEGAKAMRCENYVLDRNIQASDPEWDNPDDEWAEFIHDTCEMAWDCMRTTNTYTLHSKIENNRRKYYTIIDGRGYELNLDKKTLVGYNNTYYLMGSLLESHITIPVKCLFRNEEKVCITLQNEHGVEEGEVFLLDSSCKATNDETVLYVPCETEAGRVEKNSPFYRYIGQESSAATLEDILKVATMILFENLQEAHNTRTLKNQLIQTQTLFTKLIASISKENEAFLANLIGEKGITTWMNETHFRICPCGNLVNSDFGNCESKATYSKGMWREKSNTDICLHPSDFANGTNITLFSEGEKLSFSFLSLPSFDIAQIKDPSSLDDLHGPTVPGVPSVIKPINYEIGMLSRVWNFIVSVVKDWAWIPAWSSFLLLVRGMQSPRFSYTRAENVPI